VYSSRFAALAIAALAFSGGGHGAAKAITSPTSRLPGEGSPGFVGLRYAGTDGEPLELREMRTRKAGTGPHTDGVGEAALVDDGVGEAALVDDGVGEAALVDDGVADGVSLAGTLAVGDALAVPLPLGVPVSVPVPGTLGEGDGDAVALGVAPPVREGVGVTVVDAVDELLAVGVTLGVGDGLGSATKSITALAEVVTTSEPSGVIAMALGTLTNAARLRKPAVKPSPPV